jgi:sulfate adenylyltransferase (ADP) / ATP adenylyltransferase
MDPSSPLWHALQTQTETALATGALQPIPTAHEWIEVDGVSYLARIVDNLNRKARDRKQQQKKQMKSGEWFNPFLPYEPDLFVADLSPTHLVLLNKFNVMDHHGLIVTRAFEEQVSWLTPLDFEALAIVMAELDGLGFYNSGKLAGASQRHKHLQWVPLPMAPDGPHLPIAPLIHSVQTSTGLLLQAELPFRHGIAPLNCDWTGSVTAIAQTLLAVYTTLVQTLDIGHPEDPASPIPQLAYNLLVTRDWMMVVPRAQEKCEKLSINSLGFAGAFLVRNPEERQFLLELGPLMALRQVTYPLERT